MYEHYDPSRDPLYPLLESSTPVPQDRPLPMIGLSSSPQADQQGYLTSEVSYLSPSWHETALRYQVPALAIISVNDRRWSCRPEDMLCSEKELVQGCQMNFRSVYAESGRRIGVADNIRLVDVKTQQPQPLPSETRPEFPRPEPQPLSQPQSPDLSPACCVAGEPARERRPKC